MLIFFQILATRKQVHRHPQPSLYLVWVVGVFLLCFPLLKCTSWQDQTLANFKFSCLGVEKYLHNLQFYGWFWYPFLACAKFPTLAPPQQSLALPYVLQVWRAQQACLILTISQILQSARWYQCLVCGQFAKDAPTPAITATTLCFESLEDWIIMCNFPEVLICFEFLRPGSNFTVTPNQVCI